MASQRYAWTVIAILALLFSKSLATGCLPSVFKHAVVRPLLKKAERQLENYRPVSNSPFLSKLLLAADNGQVTRNVSGRED